jgi:hypothetical protein
MKTAENRRGDAVAVAIAMARWHLCEVRRIRNAGAEARMRTPAIVKASCFRRNRFSQTAGHATARLRQPRRSRMNDRELKEGLERFEIGITVQQRVSLADTECGDQAVDGLTDSVATTPQHPVVSSCFSRQVDAARREHFQLEQLPLDIDRGFLVAKALEHFADDEIYDTKPLAIEFRVEPVGLRVANSVEVIDPDSGVDDYHVRLLRHTAAAGLLELPIPRDLAA